MFVPVLLKVHKTHYQRAGLTGAKACYERPSDIPSNDVVYAAEEKINFSVDKFVQPKTIQTPSTIDMTSDYENIVTACGNGISDILSDSIWHRSFCVDKLARGFI